MSALPMPKALAADGCDPIRTEPDSLGLVPIPDQILGSANGRARRRRLLGRAGQRTIVDFVNAGGRMIAYRFGGAESGSIPHALASVGVDVLAFRAPS